MRIQSLMGRDSLMCLEVITLIRSSVHKRQGVQCIHLKTEVWVKLTIICLQFYKI